MGSNGTAVWYADSSLAVKVGTGKYFPVAVPTISTIYFVRFESLLKLGDAGYEKFVMERNYHLIVGMLLI